MYVHEQFSSQDLFHSFVMTPVPMHPPPDFLLSYQDPHKVIFFTYVPIFAVSTHFLLAAAAVQCTCSGDHRGRVLHLITSSTFVATA